VDFLALAADPQEGPEVVREYQQTNGYPWTFVFGDRQVLERYNMTSTAAKFGVDRQGIIVYRGGHSEEDASTWERVFEDLVRR
jgi:hypothetical protein